MTPEKAMAQGILFAGTPDTVYKQIMDFYDFVGGFGHLVMVGRSGFMTHAETEKSIELFAREVLPRLKEIAPDHRRLTRGPRRLASPPAGACSGGSGSP